MLRDTRTLLRAAFATVLLILSVPLAGFTEAQAQVDQPFPPYNPYPPLPGSAPPTVLPPDLQSELLRVRREIQTIFGRYFAEWQALTPMPTYAGNPPILVPNGYQAQRILVVCLISTRAYPCSRTLPAPPAICRTPPLAGRSRPKI